MTPEIREILRLLIGAHEWANALRTIDAFIVREGNGRFTELAQLNGPLDTPENNQLRDRLIRKILEALEDRGISLLE